MNAATFILDQQVMNNQFKKYDISSEEEQVIKNILTNAQCKTIDEFMMKRFDRGFNAYEAHVQETLATRRVFAERRRPKPICDCGSKHTSFKNHHYHWCSTRA